MYIAGLMKKRLFLLKCENGHYYHFILPMMLKIGTRQDTAEIVVIGSQWIRAAIMPICTPLIN